MTMRRTASAPARRPPGRLARTASLLLLAVAVVAVFAGVLRHDWVRLDDPGYVFDNPHVARGLTAEGVRWSLTRPHGGNWHPLTSWSHMLDVTLFGLAPAGHHAVSLLLHVVNALLLALVLFRLTGAWWRGLLVAALFALHPLRVESVAWVSERKDVLSGLFFLLTLWAYAAWAARPSARRYGLVAASLGLGLMSKPMLVTVPFVLVLLDVWPLGRLRARGAAAAPAGAAAGAGAAPRSLTGLLLEKWPLLLLAAIAAVVTYVVQSRGEATAAMEHLPLARRAGNALLSVWRYVGQSLRPVDLGVFYPYDRVLGAGGVLAAALALAAATAAALWQARRRPWLAVGWFWYLGMLVPVLGLVQVGAQAHADRYTYLPAIGLAVALVWGLGGALPRARAARGAAAAAAFVALAALGLATARQVALWRDTRTLFTHVLALTGDNLVGARTAHRFLGKALLETGETAAALPHLEASLGLPAGTEARLRDALRARPDDDAARRELAALLAREDRVEEAVGEYRRLLERDAGDLDALVNIAWMRATHREAAHRDGREAVRSAECAVVRSPEPLAVLQATLAAAYAEAGRFTAAVRAGERAVELARAAGETAEAERYERQLAHYRRGRPFHYLD